MNPTKFNKPICFIRNIRKSEIHTNVHNQIQLNE